MACKIIWEERGTLFKHSGITTNEEASKANDQMYGDHRFSMIEYQDMKFIKVVKTYFQKIMEAGWEGRIFDSLEKAYQWVLEKQTVG
jgi:hypothetical protein